MTDKMKKEMKHNIITKSTNSDPQICKTDFSELIKATDENLIVYILWYMQHES
jgi:hypothetical protein